MTFTRRALLATPLFVKAQSGIERTLHRASPAPGVAVWSFAYYTEAKGTRMRSIEQRISRSDTIDAAYVRESPDNGRTWSEPVKIVTGERRSVGSGTGGMWRKHLRAGVVHQGQLLEFWNEGVLATDDPLEGLRQWQIHFRLKGRQQQIIGEGLTAGNPWPGVYQGKNCAVLGDQACAPVADGKRVLLPAEVTLLNLENPGGGYTYSDAAVLIGTLDKGKYRWHITKPLKGDPTRSTRGLLEPTIIKLGGRRWLMVLRGSNERQPKLPSYRWFSISEDDGESWSEARTWTYTNGEPFFSPSACSQLLRHSSGRIFWLGNITAENPRGNRPRYPFWIGEVDQSTGLLKKGSLRKIDDRQPGEDEVLMLSNFYAREDRLTHEIVLHMSRLFPLASGWAGDAFDYRVRV